MNLTDVLDVRACATDLAAKDKQQAIWRLAELAGKSEAAADLDSETIFKALYDREQQGSTGFGKEIALPHARVPGMKSFLVYVGVFPRGVPFDAVDKKKVKVCFVILGPPERVQEHLRLLAGISRLLAHTNAKQEIQRARKPEVIIESIQRHIGEGEAGQPAEPAEALKLLLVTVYVESYMYDILELFLDFGIEGATILESTGMSRYISNVPLFAEFIGFMNESKNASKTILAVVPERHVSRIAHRIEEVTGDLDKREGAIVLALDLSFAKGSMKMM